MNAIPPKGLKAGRSSTARGRARGVDAPAGIAVSTDLETEDPVAEIMGDPEGMPDPAVFEAFMPKQDMEGEPGPGSEDGDTHGTVRRAAGSGPAARHRGGSHGSDTSGKAGGATGGAIPSHLAGIEVVVSVEVGRTRLPLGELLEVEPGQLFDLESLVNEPVSILVNGRPFATGEIMAVGERFGVRIVALEDPGQ
jgi:flagellar motor switch protein FliN/FliY